MTLAVITDYTFNDVEIERAALTAVGCRLDARRLKERSDLISLTCDADVVITQFARIDAEVIAAMKQVRVIARYGIGVDNVDLEAARAKGVPVCNVPDYCIDEVADQTLAMALDLTRRITQTSHCIHAGEWRLPVAIEEMRTLRDLSVGIIGFGRIGREVAARMKAFKGRVLVFDPVASAETITALGCVPATLEEIWAASDLISLHCPSTAQTRKILNAGTLAKCRKGVLIVNLSRGDLIDTQALVAALADGHVGAAALDVCDPEPIPAGHPLLAAPNVVLTPHVASVSVRAVHNLRSGVAQIAVRALTGQPFVNVVNAVNGVVPSARKQASA